MTFPGLLRYHLIDVERDWLGVLAPAPERVIENARKTGEWRPDRQRPIGVDYCPRCGGSVGPSEYQPKEGCAACRGRRFPWVRIVRLSPYRDPLRGWIHELKFSRWERMGVALGALLADAVNDLEISVDAITPMPTTWRRRVRRGVDHAEIVARSLGRRLRRPIVRPLAREARPPQWTIPISQRRANVRRTFRTSRVGSLMMVPEARLLLVDDVTTSRSTLIEATKALRSLGAASVTIAVLAAADPSRRGADVAAPPETLDLDDRLRGV